MDEILTIAIPALAGLVAGIIGSLIAPWVHWGIEKRKLRLMSRRVLISDIRHLLSYPTTKEEFRDNTIYFQLKPFLSEQTREEIESDDLTVKMGDRGAVTNAFRIHVLDELQLLENKWRLL